MCAWLHSFGAYNVCSMFGVQCSMASEFDVIIEIAEFEKEQLSNCLFARNSCVVDGID